MLDYRKELINLIDSIRDTSVIARIYHMAKAINQRFGHESARKENPHE